jgi:uncharacterized protein (DUF362 family)
MTMPKVALVRYEKPMESVRKAVELCDGLAHIPARAKVFIKPNIVFWTRAAAFPKWGVITTSRVVQDMVAILKERGIDDITIGEGTVLYDPKDRETARHAFESLGYLTLEKRYGVKTINTFERPFEKVDLGDGVKLNFSEDMLKSDFVVNIPVLKTHAQTVVSLGIKNIKGLIDVPSRKKCHSADPEKDLHFMVARLADKIPPSFTILDGIYTNERGPGFDGKMRRSNILVASSDILAVDMVGARMLGYEPSAVPHLVHAARNRGRSLDLSGIEVRGETMEDLALNLQHSFAYNESGTLPKPMEKMGITGLSYPKYDLSLCTYCSILTGLVLTAIAMAWKGEPWDDVEILTGKTMKPSPGRKKTILVGKCMYEANKDHPNIKDFVAIKTCPPSTEAVAQALIDAGIPVDPEIIRHPELAPAFLMPRYADKPEFDESLFAVE